MEFLDGTFLGSTYQQWLVAIAIALAAFSLLRFVQGIATRRLKKLAARTDTRWDDHVVEMLAETRLTFLLVLGVFIGSLSLGLPPGIRSVVLTAFVIALLIQGGIWGGVLVNAIVKDYRDRAKEENPAELTTLGLIGFAGRVAVWSLVVLLVLDNLGINITALVAGLGIGGIAVALAVQNILGDLFASLSIVLDKPFVVGDFLSIGEFLGSVERIGLKTTRLRSLSGEQLVFSNTDLLNGRIRNYGRMFERRVVFTLGVTYQTPREKLQRIPGILKEAIDAQDRTRFDRSHFAKYGSFSLDFETVYYVLTPDYNAHMDIQQAIFYTVHEQFEREGIEFAYPTQTLFVERGAGGDPLPAGQDART
jgi:small-conductance mechanosensitive channel